MKKFYTLVSTTKNDTGYAITLDGRAVKTPLKHDVITPHKNLAQAIVQEWADQGDEIIPDSMPLTQILSTRIDRIVKERDVMETTVLNYLDTDLLCYRSDAPPPELGQAQCETWDPYLDWFYDTFGIRLKTTTTIAALKHDEAAHKAVEEYVRNLEDDHFGVLQLITSISGSLILALAALHEQASANDIFTAMRVEEGFKAKIYNEDLHGGDPAQEKKDKAIRIDLEAALRYLELIS